MALKLTLLWKIPAKGASIGHSAAKLSSLVHQLLGDASDVHTGTSEACEAKRLLDFWVMSLWYLPHEVP